MAVPFVETSNRARPLKDSPSSSFSAFVRVFTQTRDSGSTPYLCPNHNHLVDGALPGLLIGCTGLCSARLRFIAIIAIISIDCAHASWFVSIRNPLAGLLINDVGFRNSPAAVDSRKTAPARRNPASRSRIFSLYACTDHHKSPTSLEQHVTTALLRALSNLCGLFVHPKCHARSEQNQSVCKV